MLVRHRVTVYGLKMELLKVLRQFSISCSLSMFTNQNVLCQTEEAITENQSFHYHSGT